MNIRRTNREIPYKNMCVCSQLYTLTATPTRKLCANQQISNIGFSWIYKIFHSISTFIICVVTVVNSRSFQVTSKLGKRKFLIIITKIYSICEFLRNKFFVLDVFQFWFNLLICVKYTYMLKSFVWFVDHLIEKPIILCNWWSLKIQCKTC